MGEIPAAPEFAAITLRTARLADGPAIASLATQLGYPSSTHQVEERITTVLHDPKHLIITAVSGDRVVGWAHAYVCCLLESDQYVELGGLVVEEAHRRRGVGGRLLEYVEGWACEQGARTVSVRSNIIRLEAHQFYLAHGYAQIKTQHAFRKGL